MIAFYDLSKYSLTFDFFTFLCAAKTWAHDAAEGLSVAFIKDPSTLSGFKPTEHPPEWHDRRMESVLMPGCELVNAENLGIKDWNWAAEAAKKQRYFPFDWPTADKWGAYYYQAVRTAYETTGGISYLVSPYPVNAELEPYVTITIRETTRNRYRNSNREAWLMAAKWIENNWKVKAVVIDDYMDGMGGDDPDAPTRNVLERMRLYSNAILNLGINHGPTAMLIYSPYPYLIFKMVSFGPASEYNLQRAGIELYKDHPWAVSNQHVIWQDDTFSNIKNVLEKIGGKIEMRNKRRA